MRGSSINGLDFGRPLRLALLRSIGMYNLVYHGQLVAVELGDRPRVITERSVAIEDAPDRFDSIADLPLAAGLALSELGIREMDQLESIVTDLES